MKEHPNAEDIEILAEIIHRGQKLANGRPYIEHPIAVSKIAENLYMEKYATRANLNVEGLKTILANVDIIRQIADLHDSFEDQPKKANRKIFEKKNILPRVIHCVELLTKDRSLSYEENIYRVLEDEFATLVKRADLAHNSRTQRLPDRLNAGMTLERVLSNNTKYILSYLFLSGAISREKYHLTMKPYAS